MDIETIKKELQKPFKPNEIEWRVGATNADKTKGIALAYITNRAIQNRLDEVVGLDNWKNEYKEWKKDSQICGISLRINGEWITKYDGADDSNMDAVKGGLSNSMKRAACQWGIGRYLYDIPNNWYKIKQVGKSYVLAETPKLPQWALPSEEIKPCTEHWEKEITEIEIPKAVQECINAFIPLGVTQADLENYMHNEAWSFTDNELTELRKVYLQLKNKEKQKDDFFETIKSPRSRKADNLTATLQGVGD